MHTSVSVVFVRYKVYVGNRIVSFAICREEEDNVTDHTNV
jgi:hypothetical protein